MEDNIAIARHTNVIVVVVTPKGVDVTTGVPRLAVKSLHFWEILTVMNGHSGTIKWMQRYLIDVESRDISMIISVVAEVGRMERSHVANHQS